MAVRLHGDDGGDEDELWVSPGSLVYRVKTRWPPLLTAKCPPAAELEVLREKLLFSSKEGPSRFVFSMAVDVQIDCVGGRRKEEGGPFGIQSSSAAL